MLDTLREQLTAIHPALVPAAALLVLVIIAWVSNEVLKRWLVHAGQSIATRSGTTWGEILIKHKAIRRIAQLLPAAVVYLGATLLPELGEATIKLIQNVSLAYMAVVAVMAISSLLDVLNDLYELRDDSRQRPIKGYIQVTKILLFSLGIILAIAALIDRSPLLLLSSLGALTAVLLLVFKDTLLSFVASIQLSSMDMVRVGDWIEMPQFNADGDVIDVALHTVRVQNWDKTITTIPTHRLISDSFRNWRGMSISGGRRIKRALLIDMASVRFLKPDEAKRFTRFALLNDYINNKQEELDGYNAALDLPTDDDVNLRRLTNLGTLRNYLFSYLENHPQIHQHMTLLVRQLQPQAAGVPIEIYCFTTTTNWNEYEAIQGDIFDHLLAILPEFGLRAYQQPSGADFQGPNLNSGDSYGS